MGATGKYNSEIVEDICKLTASGDYIVKDICTQVGITEETYYVWVRDKPEFSEAIKEAKKKRLKSLGEMAKSGLAKLISTTEYEEHTTEFTDDGTGKPKVKARKVTKKVILPNATAVIFALKNLEADTFADKTQVELSGKVSTTGFEQLTPAELRQKREALEAMLASDDDLPPPLETVPVKATKKLSLDLGSI